MWRSSLQRARKNVYFGGVGSQVCSGQLTRAATDSREELDAPGSLRLSAIGCFETAAVSTSLRHRPIATPVYTHIHTYRCSECIASGCHIAIVVSRRIFMTGFSTRDSPMFYVARILLSSFFLKRSYLKLENTSCDQRFSAMNMRWRTVVGLHVSND